jgi:hypothetical protein
MKSENVEKTTWLGATLIIFAAFLFGFATLTANSVHMTLNQFLG